MPAPALQSRSTRRRGSKRSGRRNSGSCRQFSPERTMDWHPRSRALPMSRWRDRDLLMGAIRVHWASSMPWGDLGGWGSPIAPCFEAHSGAIGAFWSNAERPDDPQVIDSNGGRYRIRTCDFHRVKPPRLGFTTTYKYVEVA